MIWWIWQSWRRWILSSTWNTLTWLSWSSKPFKQLSRKLIKRELVWKQTLLSTFMSIALYRMIFCQIIYQWKRYLKLFMVTNAATCRFYLISYPMQSSSQTKGRVSRSELDLWKFKFLTKIYNLWLTMR